MAKQRQLGKRGFVSIEALISGGVLLVTIVVVIGFFTMLYPRIALQNETAALIQIAKVQGGLTAADITAAKARMLERGYTDCTITCKTDPTSAYNLENVAALGTTGDYLKRGALVDGRIPVMKVTVEVLLPNAAKPPLEYFGLTSKVKGLRVSQAVMSERW